MTERSYQRVCEWKAIFLLITVFSLHYAVAEQLDYDVSGVSVELQEREQGVLPCVVNRRTDFVYWWRTDVVQPDFLIVLHHLSGELVRSGNGYEAGVYNVSDDFSLIINEVKQEDEGEYECQAVDLVNNIIYSKTAIASFHSEGTDTDVSSDYVVTNTFVELTEGETGILPCRISHNAASVKWTGSSYSPDYTLAKVHLYSKPVVRSGQGYGAGLFNITDDFSLVINTVRPEDEMLYRCLALSSGNDIAHYNSTRVIVRTT
ncbi:uncharacterized protein, partial [Diadema antillarum]|uniref:uncharacterized protein n=1 Tax=Diadema antillarum TaxID=105358 RepID=UPI003A8ACC2D